MKILLFFKDVEIINELNDEKPNKIINVSDNSFSIEDDNTNFGNYKIGGIIEEIIITKVIGYKKIKDCFHILYLEPDFPDIYDNSKEGRKNVTISILAIYKYYKEKNKLSEINDLKEAKDIIQNAKLIF